MLPPGPNLALMARVSPPEKTSASVAFRLKRPYGSEDELVAGDGHGIRKSGMMLFGAAPRPVGMIVRFEIALRDGTPLFRGEGKVIAHHPSPDPGQPGALQVKFTRLDPRGKALVDQAIARNEGRPPTSTRSPLSMPPPSRDSGPASIAPPYSIIPSPPESFSLDIGVTVVDPAEATPAPAAISFRSGALAIPAPPRLPDAGLLGRRDDTEIPPDTSETDLSNTRVADTVGAAVPEAAPTPVVPITALLGSLPDDPPPTVQDHTLPLELSRPKTLIPSVDLDIPVHIDIDADDPTLALPPARGSFASIDVEVVPPSSDLDEPTIAISRDKLAPRANEALPAFEPEPPSSSLAAGPLPPVVPRASIPASAPTPTPPPATAASTEIDPDELPTPDDQTMRLSPKSVPQPTTQRSFVPADPAPAPGDRDALLARLRARRADGEATPAETSPRDPAALERLRSRPAAR